MEGLSLTPALFAIFSNLIEEVCAIHHSPNDRALLASKIEAHAIDLGHASLLDYYYQLRYDDPGGVGLAKLVEAILVKETFFFRELAPLEQLVAGHITETVRRRGRARVWSAACSTGEEPLTLAMLLDEAGLLDRVEIVASDISTTAIARARSGHHIGRALRDGHPATLAHRYLVTGQGHIDVRPRIRDAVAFRVVNLLDDDLVRNLGEFDAILCRNVMIYFAEDQIPPIVARVTRALRPAGVIIVGLAESLLRFGTGLVCEERQGSFFYRSAP